MSHYSSAICSDDELLEELRKLGYDDVSSEVFNMMKEDLSELVEVEEKKTLAAEQNAHSSSSNLLSENEKSPSRLISRKTKKKTYKGSSNSLKAREDKLLDSEISLLDSPVYKSEVKNTPILLSEQTNTETEDILENSAISTYEWSNVRQLKSNLNSNKTSNLRVDSNKNSDSKHRTGSTSLSKGSYLQFDYSSVSDSRFSSNTIPTSKLKTKTPQNKYSYSFNNSNESYSLPNNNNSLKSYSLNLNSSQSSINSEIKTMKRKVLRRRNGQSIITEEILQIPSMFDTSYPESENLTTSKSFSSDDLSPKSNSSTGSLSVVNSESSLKTSPSTLSLVSTRSSFRFANSRKKKSDPVAMYGYYRKFWDNYKPPGEKTHDKLRWAVRDRMLEYNM